MPHDTAEATVITPTTPHLVPAQPDLNTYEGIAEHYDLLMNSGYYDYDAYADALHTLLGRRRRVMELGVGTGLLVDKLFERDPAYSLVGIDNTPAMLDQARVRHGDKMTFHLQDVTELALDQNFEAAFSVGGCWYFIEGSLELCSHIADRPACLRGLRRVIDHIEPGGLLAFALQGAHHDYEKPLPGGLSYAQKIDAEADGRFTKHYLIKRGDETVGEQYYSYLLLPRDEVDTFFADAGCDALGLGASGQFYVYQKRR